MAKLQNYEFVMSGSLVRGKAILCEPCAERVKQNGIPSLVATDERVNKFKYCEECNALTDERKADIADQQLTREINTAFNRLHESDNH